MFEGDRRFDLVVRLPETLPGGPRRRCGTSRSRCPTARRRRRESGQGESRSHAPAFVPLAAVAELDVAEGPNQISRENGKRRIVVQANVRGRDIGSFVDEAQAAIEREVKLPAGQLARVGRAVREPGRGEEAAAWSSCRSASS